MKGILKEIKSRYPNKTIICLPEENPTEIICEIDPAANHPEKSIALIVQGESEPHYHKISTEVYKVLRGKLTLCVDGETHILNKGEKMTIKPGQVHSSKGNNVWFLTYGEPGWVPEDHILTK